MLIKKSELQKIIAETISELSPKEKKLLKRKLFLNEEQSTFKDQFKVLLYDLRMELDYLKRDINLFPNTDQKSQKGVLRDFLKVLERYSKEVRNVLNGKEYY